MLEEMLGSFQCDIFARMAVLAVGIGPCLYGLLDQKAAKILYLTKQSFQMVADLERNVFKIL